MHRFYHSCMNSFYKPIQRAPPLPNFNGEKRFNLQVSPSSSLFKASQTLSIIHSDSSSDVSEIDHSPAQDEEKIERREGGVEGGGGERAVVLEKKELV